MFFSKLHPLVIFSWGKNKKAANWQLL